MKRIFCLLLTLTLLLSGCSLDMLQNMFSTDFLQELTPTTLFSEATYTRPDMPAHDQALAEACRLAEESTDTQAVLTGIYDYYEAYDLVNGAYTLSYIHYCQDPADLYWSKEYEYCAAVISETEAGLEELYCALSKSPVRQELESEAYFGADFFDAYEDGGIWDDQLLAYMEQEAQLQEEYYRLSDEAAEADYFAESYYAEHGLPMAQLLVELVELRQEMAEYMGYDSVAQMAYELYHYRDYTPAEVETYLQTIAEEMVPLYRQVAQSGIWDTAAQLCSTTQMYSYVQQTAQAMGGQIETAFSYMAENGLYDITYSTSKADISFETFILHYNIPYVFTNPTGTVTDQLTFAHEFGHFVNDYVCAPSYAGTDVAEVHSQAMEYLSLCYAPEGQALQTIKMSDCLETYVDQAAYALFEHRLYQLTGAELTAENIVALFREVGTQFGFDSWGFRGWDFTAIPHFYTDPMYIISYVVSNDVAFQLYQKELAQEGDGLEIYNQILTSQETYLLSFTETYGLESPFAPGRVKEVCATLEEALQ